MGKPWRERVRNFTPMWFSVSMGVGVHISLFHLFPYPGQHWEVLDGLAAGFLVFNVILFLAMSVTTIMRYAMYPETWTPMINHPVQSLFVGCCPMALSTIINGLTLLAFQRYHVAGYGFLYFIWALWWIDLAMSWASNLFMFYVMITRHKYETSTTFSVWLLPIVPTIVVGTTGCIVAGALSSVNAHLALLTTMISACSLIMGLTMATVFLVIYVQRLVLHGFPAKGTAISVFIPLGPLGQGGYGLLLVGDLLTKLLPHATSQNDYLAAQGVADTLAVLLFAFSVIVWVFGIWFLVPAAARLIISSQDIPFGLAWWALIFPTGVYTVLTLGLAQRLDSSFLNVLGAIYTVCIFAMFAVLSVRTVLALPSGSMFVAPCLTDPIATELNLGGEEVPRRVEPDPDFGTLRERDVKGEV